MRLPLLALLAVTMLPGPSYGAIASDSGRLNLAPYLPEMRVYFNPQQPPFEQWSGPQHGDRGPACFNYAFPRSGGTVLQNPMPDRLPKGWKLLPAGATLRYGDRVLYGLNRTTQHSAVVYSTDEGIATWVQEVLRPGGPVVFANPNDPLITNWMPPFAVVRPPSADEAGALFPQNAIRPGVTRCEVYDEAKWDEWNKSHGAQ